MSSLQVGPLALPLSSLVLVVAALFAMAVGRHLGRHGIDCEPALLHTLIVGLIAARLGFVWQWRAYYLDAPLSMFDIRDGGGEAAVGFAAASFYRLVQWRDRPVLRKPLVAAGVTLLALRTAGEVALAAYGGPVSRCRR